MQQVRVRLATIILVVAALAALQPLLPDDSFDVNEAAAAAVISPLPVLDFEPDRWLDLDTAGPPRPADEVRTLGDPPPPLLTADGALQLHDLETGNTRRFPDATNAAFAHRVRVDLATSRVDHLASHFVYRSTAADAALHVLDLDTAERWTLQGLPDALPYDNHVLAGRGSGDDSTLLRFWDLRTGEPRGERDQGAALEDGVQYRVPTPFGYSLQTKFPPVLDTNEEAESSVAVAEHTLIADDFNWTLGVRGEMASFVFALDAERALTLGRAGDHWVISLIALPDGEVSLLARLDPRDTFPQFSDLHRPPEEDASRHLIWHTCGRDQAAWVYAADEDRLIRLEDTDLLLTARSGAWTTLPDGSIALIDLEALSYEFALPHAGVLSADSRWLALPGTRETLRSFSLTCR